MTSLLLRVDASPSMGVGHLSRCVALAKAARARGWDVTLCGTFTAGQWLLDDLPTVTAPIPADVTLVDHYDVAEVTPHGLLVSMEDGPFGRRRADIVIDANLDPASRPDDGTPVVLRGPAYAPLRPEIRAARESRTSGSTPPHVLVVMGGGVAPTAVASAVEVLRATGVPASVTAISATEVPNAEVIAPTPDLPSLLASADLVVSAAGVTLLELCCIGTPAALVQIADNQAAGYQAAVTRGLAAGLGTDPREHVATLRALLLHPEQREALASKAMATVDGRGTERILDAIETALRRLVVRGATQRDSALLLAWRNDSETRAWSRTTEPVSAHDHEAWLTRVLADPGRRLLVAELHGRPIGMVRFDRDGGHWEVSITVAPEARGRKLAVPMLIAAERSIGPADIRACVHRDNMASQALFRKAGYQPDRQDGDWLWFARSV